MKKSFIMAAFVAASMLFSACGSLGTSGNTNLLAGSNQNTTTSVLTSAGTSVLGTLMSSLLGNTTTQMSVVGSWYYTNPKIAFESENILAQLGSAVATNQIEQKLNTQLTKLGFTPGKTTMTFTDNGVCTLTLGTRTLNGTYVYNTASNQMTIQGTFGLASITPTVSVVGTEMYILFDADKLLSVMNAVSKVSKASTLTNLLTSYNGVKVGWAMSRK